MTDTMFGTGPSDSPGARPLRCVPYIRVSTPDQVKAFGFDAQRRELPQIAARFGWEVVGVYEEPGISGDSLEGRPSMVRLLGDAANGDFDVVIAIEEERFSRGELSDWQIIKSVCDANGVALASPSGIFYRPLNEDDDFTSDIRGVLSKREKRKIANRVARGRKEASHQGCLVMSHVPYGYRQEPYDRPDRRERGLRRMRSEKRLVIHEEEAAIVHLIYQLAAHGLDGTGGWGIKRIATYLNDTRQAPAQRGGRWHGATVAQLVAHPVYRGEWYFGRTRVLDKRTAAITGKKIVQVPREEWIIINDPEIVPPIVSPELWEAANAARARRNLHPTGRPATKGDPALFASYVRCAHCGYVLRHRHDTRPYCKRNAVYVCTGRDSGCGTISGRCCDNRRWPAAILEPALWERIEAIVQQPELLFEIAEADRCDCPELPMADVGEARRRLAGSNEEIARVKAAYRRKLYTLDELEAELDAIRKEREGLEAQLASMADQLAARELWEETVRDAAALCRQYREGIKLADAARKRQIVEGLVEEIALDAEGNFWIDLVTGKREQGRINCEGYAGLGRR